MVYSGVFLFWVRFCKFDMMMQMVYIKEYFINV